MRKQLFILGAWVVVFLIACEVRSRTAMMLMPAVLAGIVIWMVIATIVTLRNKNKTNGNEKQ